MTTYEQRGVSPHKPDVKKAVSSLNTNVFPGAFCWIVNDVLTGSPDHVVVTHADGAGTKSSLAYIAFREGNDASVFRGIAQDSLAMNIDDMIASGCTGPFVLSNTIGRNAKIIGGDIVSEIINGYRGLCSELYELGIEIEIGGGETADMGDVVRTIVVDTTLTTIMKRNRVIDCSEVTPGSDIVGISSYGKANYEKKENSGIGTNGFTALRHDLLHASYSTKYPESYAPEISEHAYRGKYFLSDDIDTIGGTLQSAVLSPTRIYAPIIKQVIKNAFGAIQGIFHNSGGGQTKALAFGSGLHYLKDNPITPSPIFDLIRSETNISLREMARTYNMGSRMEIVCDPGASQEIISICESFGVHAQVVGRVLPSNKSAELTYVLNGETAHFERS